MTSGRGELTTESELRQLAAQDSMSNVHDFFTQSIGDQSLICVR